jgi:ribosome-binding factor A
MKNNSRIIRIDDEILKEVSNIIRGELQDPRIGSMTTVVKVETSSDLSHCKVHVSVFGDDDAKKSALEGLQNSQGFIRKQIASRINLRSTPRFNFVLDETLEHGIRMSKLIESVAKTTDNNDEV